MGVVGGGPAKAQVPQTIASLKHPLNATEREDPTEYISQVQK